MSSVHEGVKYKCIQCEKEFTQKVNMSTHVKEVHEQIKYWCTLCNYQATRQNYLKKHKEAVHNRKETNRKYKSSTSIRQEIKNTIQHIRLKYPCDSCSKDYKSLGALSNHKKEAHEGIRYNCDICNYQATQKGNLMTHVKNKHLN